ncbi:MAG: hypothetical protein E4H40_00705 [Candidatus Brocadiia bacterium]|nr:MAG: hypothetical protein E4H40_00705 [Candidatus Brocadiia bacterium]
MKKIIFVLAVMISIRALGQSEPNDPNKLKPMFTGKTYVMIVSGLNTDPDERQSKDRAVLNLRKFFGKKLKVDDRSMKVLVCSNSFAKKDSLESTAANLEKAFSDMAGMIGPGDRFVFYYVGHANLVAGSLRINLPGTDITGSQLAEWINRIKAESMLVVLDCPGAGLVVKKLAVAGRVIICSCRSDQLYSPRFSDYFVPALEDSVADSDGDGEISVLDAFTLASQQIDELYREQDLLKTETPLLEDNGDGIPSELPWRYQKDKNDGQTAAKFFLKV